MLGVDTRRNYEIGCLQGKAYIYDARANKLPKEIPLYGSGFPFTPLTAAQVRLWSEEMARSTAVRRQELDIWEGKRIFYMHVLM
jgi:hypothetical protein